MTAYTPVFVGGNQVGLVQNREDFILPNDAYPSLENAFVWRERIKRKQAYQLLGRLRRVFTAQSLGTTDGSGDFSGDLIAIFSLESSAEIQVGSVVVSDGTNTFTDNSKGNLVGSPGGSGTIQYVANNLGKIPITITGGIPMAPLTISFNYYPCLPVMGIRYRDLSPINNEMTVFFDTRYAYNFTASGFVEFIPGTTWSYSLPNANSNFFWTTNWWTDTSGNKIFWATNDSGTSGDPIRYTNGSGSGSGAWASFAPPIDGSGNLLTQCLCLLPFRGSFIAFNTLEGPSLSLSKSYPQRVRWSAIGTPFTVNTGSPDVDFNPNAWLDTPGNLGGYLDIPTAEDIVTVGFVRDNLVIYCENSTWQLRYTGRRINPFQIEKVNTELGAGSTFSAVQFDTSLVGIGDKGVVTCDSFRSERMDIKIPDLVMNHINNNNNGQKRVHGIRDYLQRLAFWTYPETDNNGVFPDRRLVYNYENDSWAIFTDSLTTLGNFQPVSSRTWANPSGGSPSTKVQWQEANFPWVSKPSAILSVVGGNQQGYIEFLDQQTTNDPSLTITAISGNQITSANHNMQTGSVISISAIPTGTPGSNLNGGIFGVVVNGTNTFLINSFNPATNTFNIPAVPSSGTYIGGGQISVRDNFVITSKKFNYLDEGQNVQIGYIDILMNTSPEGAITMNVYVDYNDSVPMNAGTDSFFNTTISQAPANSQQEGSSKTNQRVFCAIRGNYLTVQYTFSNAQMAGLQQENDVQIDMQILWMRAAGRIAGVGLS